MSDDVRDKVPTRIADIEDVALLRKIESGAHDSLANPFTSRWGRECAEYRLHDVKQRLAELAESSEELDTETP